MRRLKIPKNIVSIFPHIRLIHDLKNIILAIGRKLIGRFFRTMFDTGVRELYFLTRSPPTEQTSNWGGCLLDCENVVMFTRLSKPLLNSHVGSTKILNKQANNLYYFRR